MVGALVVALAAAVAAASSEVGVAPQRQILVRSAKAQTTPDAEYWLEGDHVVVDRHSHDALPGSPMPRAWTGDLPLFNITPWRAELGERLFRLVDGSDALRACPKFLVFGDYTWCQQAMPVEASKFRAGYRGMHEYILNSSASASTRGAMLSSFRTVLPNGDVKDAAAQPMVGISLGISTSDPWSELVSSLYGLKTRLFDCYVRPEDAEGPIFEDLHTGFSKARPCLSRRCYTTAYEASRVCVDDSPAAVAQGGPYTAKDGKRFTTLQALLEGLGEQSVLLKMDVEGSEFDTLERLMERPADIAKIRTLDVEVHLNNRLRKHDETAVTRYVGILERLTAHFAVTGSTIDHLHKALIMKLGEARKKDPKTLVKEPAIYTASGLALEQFGISFINRRLL